MTSFTLASWNIAAGRTSKSNVQFDYNEEQLTYFQDMLAASNADVICLQEVHANEQRNQADELAKMLEMPYIYYSDAHPSHIDPMFRMGNAILSRTPFEKTNTTFFPNPWFDMYFKDGRKAKEHPKNVQTVRIHNIHIGNLHLLSLRLFSLGYDDRGLGSQLATKIENVLQSLPTPLILTGDFNFGDPVAIYPNFIKSHHLSEIDWQKKDSDHIFYSQECIVKNHSVIETESDHNLYVAEFQV